MVLVLALIKTIHYLYCTTVDFLSYQDYPRLIMNQFILLVIELGFIKTTYTVLLWIFLASCIDNCTDLCLKTPLLTAKNTENL